MTGYDFDGLDDDALTVLRAEQVDLLADLGDRQRAAGPDTILGQDLELEVLAGFELVAAIDAERGARA